MDYGTMGRNEQCAMIQIGHLDTHTLGESFDGPEQPSA